MNDFLPCMIFCGPFPGETENSIVLFILISFRVFNWLMSWVFAEDINNLKALGFAAGTRSFCLLQMEESLRCSTEGVKYNRYTKTVYFLNYTGR